MNFLKKNIKEVHLFGASRGIGKAIALHLASTGIYNINLYSRSSKDIKALVNEIFKITNKKPKFFLLDIRNLKKLEKKILKIKKADIIINNASINIIKKYEHFNLSDFNLMMETNFRSFFFICKNFIKKFKKKKLNIINISSIMGKVSQPIDSDRPQTMYICMKHALEGLTKSLCTEFAGGNLKINSICPGYVMTDMVKNTFKDKKKLKKIIKKIPLKKLVSPKDVAYAVEFLCSEKSVTINGSSLMVDGGWTAY